MFQLLGLMSRSQRMTCVQVYAVCKQILQVLHCYRLSLPYNIPMPWTVVLYDISFEWKAAMVLVAI